MRPYGRRTRCPLYSACLEDRSEGRRDAPLRRRRAELLPYRVLPSRLFPVISAVEAGGPEVELHDGQWTLPDKPGLGVDLNDDIVKECLVRPPTIVE